MNNNNSSNGFSHGFILGALIGGGIVFLFGTTKGKKLLKTITEEGLEGIADLEDLSEEETEYEDVDIDQPAKEANKSDVKQPSSVEKVVSTTRRLFRGIPKKG